MLESGFLPAEFAKMKKIPSCQDMNLERDTINHVELKDPPVDR